MHSSHPSSYARSPTFAQVMDVVASGLGIVGNREDALTTKATFEKRIRRYRSTARQASFSSNLGLEQEIVRLLAGADGNLEHVLAVHLRQLELDLAEARSRPLHTNASETSGFRSFICNWALPWFVDFLNGIDQDDYSILYATKAILGGVETRDSTYINTWKRFVNKAIPQGAKVPAFRSEMSRIDERSIMKNDSIEELIASFGDELEGQGLDVAIVNLSVQKMRAIFLAGMITRRFHSMTEKIVPGLNLINSIIFEMNTSIEISRVMREKSGIPKTYQNGSPRNEFLLNTRIRAMWTDLGDDQIFEENRLQNGANFSQCDPEIILKIENHVRSPVYLDDPPFVKAAKALVNERFGEATEHLQEVIDDSHFRQLGNIAAAAAKFLIALKIIRAKGLKENALNPLVQILIDSSKPLALRHHENLITPFSDDSQIPILKNYEFYILNSCAYFNSVMFSLGIAQICNPMKLFFDNLGLYILKSQKAHAKMSLLERERRPIIGTSIPLYDVIRDLEFYIDIIFRESSFDRSKISAYSILTRQEKLCLLRYVDKDRFLADIKIYNFSKFNFED